MTGDARRPLRVAEIIRAEFTTAVLKRLDDPRMAALVVTRVHVSDDLSVIDIAVRFMGAEAAADRQKLFSRLRRAMPRLTRAILPRLELRRAPELRLHYDEGQDAARRVDELLDEISRDPKSE
ncbi:MAG TPA: 30S ribosome-binding factor RbfA [Polyangiaceae bacterium]|nr:30S ribosome-binding factor RbfA [Polyangiaceae bacterium]